MFVIVVGGGEIGRNLTNLLSEEKHDVTIVERDKDICQELANELNAKIINGNATHLEVLEEAGLDKADAVAVVTGKDEMNLLCSLIVKENSHARIVTRASSNIYKKIFYNSGINTVISPETSSAELLESLIIEPDIMELASVHRGDIELLEFEVKPNSKVVGMNVKDLEYPKGSAIVAIKKGDNYLIPTGKTKIIEGEKVIIIVKKDFEDKVKKLFKT